eukprot:SAG11_NODE_13542_length_650_cov_1.613430_1_plen_179_part_00
MWHCMSALRCSYSANAAAGSRRFAPRLRLELVCTYTSGTASAPPVRVFGHKIPDTDAVCSAIVRAWELEQHGVPAIAHRLGELNKETSFVLETLGVPTPPLLPPLTVEDRVAIVDTNNPQELPDDLCKDFNAHKVAPGLVPRLRSVRFDSHLGRNDESVHSLVTAPPICSCGDAALGG